jgi:membrane carboxypeptidase/penicillin-binding protein
MNVPSVKVLQMVGFDAAIKRAAALLGIEDPAEIQKTFPRVYPLALGVVGVKPIQMARSYAVFANAASVEPIANLILRRNAHTSRTEKMPKNEKMVLRTRSSPPKPAS